MISLVASRNSQTKVAERPMIVTVVRTIPSVMTETDEHTLSQSSTLTAMCGEDQSLVCLCSTILPSALSIKL